MRGGFGGSAGGGRIGVFGGSFDPPHLAHLALARLAWRELALDELRFVPAGQPWQKAGRTLAGREHREAMLRLLLAGDPAFSVDTRELDRTGPSYTVDTVRELQAEHPGAYCVLVIGQDQYGRFDTWREARWLLEHVSLAVAARGGEAPVPPPALAGVPHRLHVLPLPDMPVSSTAIRIAAAQGRDVTPMAGEAVAGYIARHCLYRDGVPT